MGQKIKTGVLCKYLYDKEEKSCPAVPTPFAWGAIMISFILFIRDSDSRMLLPPEEPSHFNLGNRLEVRELTELVIPRLRFHSLMPISCQQ